MRTEGQRVSGGTIGENARVRYRVRAGLAPRGIPVPRTSQLPTNQFLPLRQSDLLTGVYQQDSSSKPPPAPLILHPAVS